MKKNIALTPDISTLFGTRDENLHVLEDGLNINIDLRSTASNWKARRAMWPAPNSCLRTTSTCASPATSSSTAT